MRSHSIPNQHIISGEVAFIALTDRSKQIIAVGVIDADSLASVIAEGRWSPTWSPVMKRHYIHSNHNGLTLHRFLLNAPAGLVVDHENGNPLDCRRINMRLCTQAENLQNRRVAKHSASGVRNVYWDKITNKWAVSFKVGGKRIWKGKFETFDAACEAANRIRPEMFPFAADRNRGELITPTVSESDLPWRDSNGFC